MCLACNHPLLVSKDYKKDLEAVESQASKKDSEADADDLVAAFGQMGVAAPKCQMCTMEYVHSSSKCSHQRANSIEIASLPKIPQRENGGVIA